MNTDKTILLKNNKTLKLTNVVAIESTEYQDDENMLVQFVNHNSLKMIGPLVYYSSAFLDSDGEVSIVRRTMTQVGTLPTINSSHITTYSNIKVENCLFARFRGREEDLKYAFSKIELHAYENNIQLKGDSYTILLEGEEQGDIIADVFMETLSRGLNK